MTTRKYYPEVDASGRILPEVADGRGVGGRSGLGAAREREFARLGRILEATRDLEGLQALNNLRELVEIPVERGPAARGPSAFGPGVVDYPSFPDPRAGNQAARSGGIGSLDWRQFAEGAPNSLGSTFPGRRWDLLGDGTEGAAEDGAGGDDSSEPVAEGGEAGAEDGDSEAAESLVDYLAHQAERGKALQQLLIDTVLRIVTGGASVPGGMFGPGRGDLDAPPRFSPRDEHGSVWNAREFLGDLLERRRRGIMPGDPDASGPDYTGTYDRLMGRMKIPGESWNPIPTQGPARSRPADDSGAAGNPDVNGAPRLARLPIAGQPEPGRLTQARSESLAQQWADWRGPPDLRGR